MANSFTKIRHRFSGLITILSLTLAYLAAFLIDTYLNNLQESAGSTFNFRPAFLLSSAVPLINVIGILALAWLVFRYLPARRFTAILFILSGLFIGAAYLSIFTGFPLGLRTTFLGKFRLSLMDFGPQSSTYCLAAGCLVIGIAALIRAARERRLPSADV